MPIFEPFSAHNSTFHGNYIDKGGGFVIKKLLFLLILVFFLSGCSAKPQYKVVTQIEVSSYENRFRYHTHPKMEKFLYYLRSLETWGPAELDQLAEQEFQIILSFSDGSTKIYRQRGSQCLAVNDGGWCKIDNERGSKLPLLLEAVPPDG